ncbi:MAG: hypothetical protein R3C68_00910 [Myxococcota bacterium]
MRELGEKIIWGAATTALLLFFVLLAWNLPACGVATKVRRYTYPPEFHYIQRGEIHQAMHDISRTVRRLDEMLRLPVENGVDSQEVIMLLEQLQRSIASIKDEGDVSNRERVDAHLERFREDVSAALRGARAVPPNYFLAGSVTGSCRYCHK